jgi:hypothetical protein
MKSSLPRVKRYEDKQREKGLLGRKKWATDEEHKSIDRHLAQLREIRKRMSAEPRSALRQFTAQHGGQTFSIEEFRRWVVGEFGTPMPALVQAALCLPGVIELGDSAYQSPFGE